MAFIRVERKKSGTYLRIVQSYKVDGQPRHKTLHSLGKVEDYAPHQLERIAKKLLELSGANVTDIINKGYQEAGRYNYGYGVVLDAMWSTFNLPYLVRVINNRHKVTFRWDEALRVMIAERINEPGSKLSSYFNQQEYKGLSSAPIELHHFYRTLDLICQEEETIKKHLFSQQRTLFAQQLDVVFYDVTTLYFDSQVEQEGALRQKGYSKDGKATKTQVVLGLLVDKLRNPISYQIYQGNTYEGTTMIHALNSMKSQYNIDRVIVVADTAMIDKANRDFMVNHHIDYIIGDSVKNLGKKISSKLIDRSMHINLSNTKDSEFSYTEQIYKKRRIICTYSAKRARKDQHNRQKLIDKAKKLLEEPSKLNQLRKRGAGRFITTDPDGQSPQLDVNKVNEDAKYDGFKALSTTTDLSVELILEKYRDLFEVEHSFRSLKSDLEIRPMFHWTDRRIRGHVCMCFMAFTMINHIRNSTQLQHKQIVKAMDKMQISDVQSDSSRPNVYLRSAIDKHQQVLIDKLGLRIPASITPQPADNLSVT